MCEWINLTFNNTEYGLFTSFFVMAFIIIALKIKGVKLQKDEYDAFQVNILISIIVAFSVNSLLYILTTKDVPIFIYFILPISIILITLLYHNSVVNTMKVVAQFSTTIFIVSLVYAMKEDSLSVGFLFACSSAIGIMATLYINSQKTNNNQNLEIDEIKNKVKYLVTVEEQELFKNLCQSGKITNTQGNTDEDRNRCRAICS